LLWLFAIYHFIVGGIWGWGERMKKIFWFLIDFKFINPFIFQLVELAESDSNSQSFTPDIRQVNQKYNLKGVFAKNERGYRLNAIKKRFWSLLILLLIVASIRRKLLKTTNTEERSIHTNSERCNIRLRFYIIQLVPISCI